MGGLVEAVSDDLLEISEAPEKEGHGQMVEFCDENKRSKEEKEILTALSFMGESNCEPMSIKIERKSRR